jgi:hypothetical protein
MMKRLASSELGRRLVALGACRGAAEAYGLIKEWGASGEVNAISPMATVGGKLQPNYQIPKDVWRTLNNRGPGTFGHFDMHRGCVELFGTPFRLHAPLIEFELGENARALVATVDAVQKREVATSGAITRATDWLIAQFADKATRRTPKAAFMAAARAADPALSERGFEAAWRAASVEYPDRTKAGAKPKSPR